MISNTWRRVLLGFDSIGIATAFLWR